jgi:hypothetical protein
LLNPRYEERFESEQGRYVVQLERDRVVKIYDTVLRKQIEDSWLDAVGRDFLSREDLGNRHVHMTNDRRCVIVCPESSVQVGCNGKERTLEEFVQDGKAYRREDHFLIYTRPQGEPLVHDGSPHRGMLKFAKFVEIDGKPLFLDTNYDIRLRDVDDHVVFSLDLPANEKWISNFGPGGGVTCIANDPAGKRIVFYKFPYDMVRQNIRLAMWCYWDKSLTTYEFCIGDFFEKKRDGYHPKQCIPLEE